MKASEKKKKTLHVWEKGVCRGIYIIFLILT